MAMAITALSVLALVAAAVLLTVTAIGQKADRRLHRMADVRQAERCLHVLSHRAVAEMLDAAHQTSGRNRPRR